MRRQWGKGLDIRQREFVGQYRSKVSPFSQRLGVTKRWAGEQGQWNGMTVGGGSLGPPFLRASLGSPCRWPHPDCFPWLCQIPLSLTGLMGRKYRRGRVGRETPPGLPLLWEIWLFDLKKQIVQILGRRNEKVGNVERPHLTVQIMKRDVTWLPLSYNAHSLTVHKRLCFMKNHD